LLDRQRRKVTKSINDRLDEQIDEQLLKRGSAGMDDLPNKELYSLATHRASKPIDLDQKLQETILSLSKMLDRMPDKLILIDRYKNIQKLRNMAEDRYRGIQEMLELLTKKRKLNTQDIIDFIENIRKDYHKVMIRKNVELIGQVEYIKQARELGITDDELNEEYN